MRQRRHPEQNYFAIYMDGKTLRFAIDATKPILPLPFPEIEDVSIGSKCLAACPYCYTSATKHGSNHGDVVRKVLDHYGSMDENCRPFQVAIGGEGEPTMHPDFVGVLEAFHSLGITPNYTTNGMHLSDTILDATKTYCGGVAVSCHSHLEKVWRRAAKTYADAGVKTCLHVIVGEPGTADEFWRIYDSTDDIHYYVALPYMAAGRGKRVETESEWDGFFAEAVARMVEDVSYGALFYDYFLRKPDAPSALGVSLYEPEVLSGYRIMDDSYRLLRKSSYDLRPKFDSGAQLGEISLTT